MIDRAVILAGGGGTRLWPWTTPELPKPLLPLGGGGRSLLAACIDRLDTVVPPGRLAIQAEPRLARILARGESCCAELSFETEPSGRDTGPAVALAMRRALDADPSAVVAILPADQRVEDEAAFRQALVRAGELAREGELVTLGVRPTRAATGFGYIEAGESLAADPAAGRRVRRFVEKPDRHTAEAYLRSGGFFWNAGTFIWRADRFWQALGLHAPELAAAVEAFVASGEGAEWETTPRISIDYALMEKAGRVAVVPLDAGWDDVGGWEAVARLAMAGDAGPVHASRIHGEQPESIVLCLDDAPPPAVILGREPLIVVVSRRGVLAAPRGGLAGLKTSLPAP